MSLRHSGQMERVGGILDTRPCWAQTRLRCAPHTQGNSHLAVAERGTSLTPCLGTSSFRLGLWSTLKQALVKADTPELGGDKMRGPSFYRFLFVCLFFLKSIVGSTQYVLDYPSFLSKYFTVATQLPPLAQKVHTEVEGWQFMGQLEKLNS